MKKLQILFTAALLVVGLGLSAAADGCGSSCCKQQGVKAGWFTGSGTLAKAGCENHVAGHCCDGQAPGACCGSKADAKAGSCCEGKADGKAGSCCEGKADGKAGDCGGKCSGNCKKN